MRVRTATFWYRASGDSVFVAPLDIWTGEPGIVMDTFFVRSGDGLNNTVEIGGGCQYDPTCVPGGEFRDARFEYRRRLPN